MTKILFVDSAIAAALFNSVIRPEFENPKGKWSRQPSLVAEWTDVTAVYDPDILPGRTFAAQKTNWNVNDSNWVNPTTNYQLLAATARAANGGTEVPKKRLTGILEDLKFTFGKETSIPVIDTPIEPDMGPIVELPSSDPIIDDSSIAA